MKKRREIWRNIILKNLLKENLQKKLLNEKRICLILDNFSVHKSEFIKKIAKILNIELINLPPYSPTLKSYRTALENNEKYNSQRILKIQRTSKRTSQKNYSIGRAHV